MQTLSSTFIHVEGIFEIATLRIVPWGTSYFGDIDGDTQYQTNGPVTWMEKCGQAASHPVPNACWTGKALCQDGGSGASRGENECLANRIQGCVVHILGEIAGRPESKPEFWNFIECYANNTTAEDQSNDPQVPVQTLYKCEQHLSDDISRAVKECYSGPEGIRLQVEAAKATASLSPPHSRVPWITVDGTDVAAGEVLAKVCNSYRGPKAKPVACPQTVGR